MRTPSRGLWAALATVFFGTGLGLALAGRPRAALAWFGVIVIATCALVVTPWVAVGVLAIHFGSAIHAYLCASRSEQPDAGLALAASERCMAAASGTPDRRRPALARP